MGTHRSINDLFRISNDKAVFRKDWPGQVSYLTYLTACKYCIVKCGIEETIPENDREMGVYLPSFEGSGVLVD